MQTVRQVNQQKLALDQGQKEQSFYFDRVFAPSFSQQEVLDEVDLLVTSCLDGYNACVMAYGQTGSGKTYTMVGTDEHPGLYFTAIDSLFAIIEERKEAIVYTVNLSVIEIYKENVRDLLSKTAPGDQQHLKVRENTEGETYINEQIFKKCKNKG